MRQEELFNRNMKYEIFIGIKDKDSYEEILNVDDFKAMLTEICGVEPLLPVQPANV